MHQSNKLLNPQCGKVIASEGTLVTHIPVHYYGTSATFPEAEQQFNSCQQITEALNVVNGGPVLPEKRVSIQLETVDQMQAAENQRYVTGAPRSVTSRSNENSHYCCCVCGKLPSSLTLTGTKSYVCESCGPEGVYSGTGSSSRSQSAKQFGCVTSNSDVSEANPSSRVSHIAATEVPSSREGVSELKERKKMVCCSCDKQFSKAYDLRRHMRTHTGEKPYACSYCDRRFALRSTLKRHFGTHIVEKSYRCRVCLKGLSCASTLKAHMRIHNNECYECPRCSHRFKKKCRFTAHLNGRPNCARKGKKQAGAAAAKSSDEKTTNLLADMPLLKETDRGLVPLWKGNANRVSEADYWRRRFACSFCQKRFLKLSHLVCHIRVHTKERPYTCYFCKSSFATSSTLRDHMTSHSKTRDFRCNVCAKTFVLQRSLNRHMSIHSEEAPYVCPICYKRFRRREHCRMHVDGHSAEFPGTQFGDDVVPSTVTGSAGQHGRPVEAPIGAYGQRFANQNFGENPLCSGVYVSGSYPTVEGEAAGSGSQLQEKSLPLRFGFGGQMANARFNSEASLCHTNFKHFDDVALGGVELTTATELYLCYGCALIFSRHVDLVKHLLDGDLSAEHFNLILCSIRDYNCHLCIDLSPFGAYEDYAKHMELFHALVFHRQCPFCFIEASDGFELSRHIAQDHIFRTWLLLANGEGTTSNIEEAAGNGFLLPSASPTSCIVPLDSRSMESQPEVPSAEDSISAILASMHCSSGPPALPAIPSDSLPVVGYSNEQTGIMHTASTAGECPKSGLLRIGNDGVRNERLPFGDERKSDHYCRNGSETERVNVYLCTTCGKEFLRRDSLARHRKNHTNPRANCCEFCQKLFGRKDTLLKHKRSKHAVQMT